jgi:hypothetical protein
MTTTTSMAIIAIVATLALLGVVVVTVAVTIPLQEAEAGCERGAPSVKRSMLQRDIASAHRRE